MCLASQSIMGRTQNTFPDAIILVKTQLKLSTASHRLKPASKLSRGYGVGGGKTGRPRDCKLRSAPRAGIFQEKLSRSSVSDARGQHSTQMVIKNYLCFIVTCNHVTKHTL